MYFCPCTVFACQVLHIIVIWVYSVYSTTANPLLHSGLCLIIKCPYHTLFRVCILFLDLLVSLWKSSCGLNQLEQDCHAISSLYTVYRIENYVYACKRNRQRNTCVCFLCFLCFVGSLLNWEFTYRAPHKLERPLMFHYHRELFVIEEHQYK